MHTRGRALATAMVLAIIMVMFFVGVLWAVEPTTIVGEVDDEFQIVATDGEIYTIADTEIGIEVATKHVGEVVKAVCTISYSEEDDMKVVTIKSYKVVPRDVTEVE